MRTIISSNTRRYNECCQDIKFLLSKGFCAHKFSYENDISISITSPNASMLRKSVAILIQFHTLNGCKWINKRTLDIGYTYLFESKIALIAELEAIGFKIIWRQ